MSESKPFLSYEQQLDKLQNEKNLIITDRGYAERTLKRIGYFALVSGYKTLLRNPTTKKYKDGVTFEEIVALYNFDTNLRALFMKHLLQIEQNMRSLLSYYFTEENGSLQSAYLSYDKYDAAPKNRRGIENLIAILRDIAFNATEYPYITHQRRKYANVPLWVLAKVLTFGKISKMYQYYPPKLRSKISKEFGYVREKALGQFLRVLTKFRNVCAHNERLFSYSTMDNIPDTPLHEALNISKKRSQYICGKRDLFSVVIAFRYLLPDDDFRSYLMQLSALIKSATAKIEHISKNELLREMGFPENWIDISECNIQEPLS
jgi:abortive infection bacteriophage resistance protein